MLIMTAAAPNVVPLPADNQARTPASPDNIMPKTGIKIANTEIMIETIPNEAIVPLSQTEKFRLNR